MKARLIFDHVAICKEQNPEARLRLFCFPFAGGGEQVFNSWVGRLPPDVRQEIELWSINLPGHEANRRELLYRRLSPLLEVLVPLITPYLNPPFVLFGHSMGALVSFELARQLRSNGIPGPIHMVVSGYRAPQLPDSHPALHQLPDPKFLAKLRELGGTPEEVLQNIELMEMFLPVLRADLAVCETYVYRRQEPLDCSITAFGGNNDRQVSLEEISAWRSQTQKSFVLHMFPGDHFFHQSARSLVLQVLAQDLRQVLRRLSVG